MKRERSWGRSSMLACLLAAAGLAAGAGLAVAQSDELVVVLPGGTLEKVLRRSWVEPFEKKTHAKATVVTGLTMENLAKLRAQKGNPQIDVVIFDPPGAIPAANEGLLEKLDPARIEIQKHGFFATDWLSNQVLAYNTKYVKEPPKSWADLWKPEYKGKVILPDISTSHGVFFVSIVSKMETGNDLYNTDAAYAKLKTLRPNVLTLWTSHDQVAQLLNSGEAWLAPWTSDRALSQVAAKAPIGLTVPREGRDLLHLAHRDREGHQAEGAGREVRRQRHLGGGAAHERPRGVPRPGELQGEAHRRAGREPGVRGQPEEARGPGLEQDRPAAQRMDGALEPGDPVADPDQGRGGGSGDRPRSTPPRRRPSAPALR